MKTFRNTIFCCLMALCLLNLVGCGKKADESKPIDEVKAEAEKMNIDQLRSMALKYKDAIIAKNGEIDGVVSQLKEIPITKKLGAEAKELKTEFETLSSSLSALNQRLKVYYDKLKEKGADLSDLKP